MNKKAILISAIVLVLLAIAAFFIFGNQDYSSNSNEENNELSETGPVESLENTDDVFSEIDNSLNYLD